MTSNIGPRITSTEPPARFGRTCRKIRKDQLHDKLIAALKETVRFLNRVDEIIIFDRLGEEEIKQIASHMLNASKNESRR